MNITLKKIALSEHEKIDTESQLPLNNNSFLNHIEVPCMIRLGTLTLSIAELNQLKQGQILELEQKTQEPVQLLINNQVIALGELMCCDEHFAIQIKEIYS